jgi:hypothetical protein
MAAQDAQVSLNEMQQWRGCEHCMERFWFSAQSIVVAAANITKAFWGSGRDQKQIEERRTPLRTSLGITEDSVFRLMSLRNHLEHFDERLDEWLEQSARKWHIDGSIGDITRLIEPPPEPVEVFRFFNPANGDLTFWGDKVSIPGLVTEASELLPKALVEASKSHWEPPPNASGGG